MADGRRAIVLLTALWMVTPTQAGDTISHRSPDKQFGIQIVEPVNAAPRVELVALPSHTRVIELDPRLAGSGWR
jgi:hypothetical protein